MTAETAEVVTEERLPDAEIILPQSEELTLNGIPCYVRHLKAREFMSLMGVLTSGMGRELASLDFKNMTESEAAGTLMGALLMSIPNAQHKFFGFIQEIVDPIEAKDMKV